MGIIFKQTEPHSAGCFMVAGRSPWVFPYDIEADHNRRDAMGRILRKGGWRRWLVVRCNDPLCEGRAIVRLEDFLNELPYGERNTRPGVPDGQGEKEAGQ